MKGIKLRYVWISVLVSFLLAVGLIIGVTQTSGAWTKVFIVLIAIVFIYMTIAIQYASTKTFRYKAKPIKYPQIEYEFDSALIDEHLSKIGYKARVTPYGISYLKVNKTDAYKIVLVRDVNKYFNHEENNSNHSSEKTLEKCKRFIGAEVFFDYDDECLAKLPDFNFSGTNVYYTAFYVEDNNKLVCLNYIEPDENFALLYSNLKADLKAVDVDYGGEENV